MKLSAEQIAELRKKISALRPEERRLLRALASEPKPTGPLPRKKPKPPPEPEPEYIRSFNGDLLRRRRR